MSDWARPLSVMPGPQLLRIFESIDDTELKDFPKSRDHILAKGAACGLDEFGECCHMGQGVSFVGFLEGQSQDRAGVKTRGSIVLKIDGVTDADRGKPVYCSNANNFSLTQQRGSAEIGRIRFVQNGKAAVTLSVYAHLMKGENQEAACRLEKAIFKGTGHKTKKGANRERLTP